MKSKYKLVLASSSPRRLHLLQRLNITPHLVISPEIDETPHQKEHPYFYSQRMAQAKAQKVIESTPPSLPPLIIAADTVACCGHRILPKATTKEEAYYCLNMVSGRQHTVITSVCIMTNDKSHLRTIVSKIKFKRLSPQELDEYLKTQQWQGMAGGYSIEGAAGAFIRSINGSDTSIIGLPLFETSNLLKQYEY